MLHAVMVRSTEAHANIRGIDIASARAADGVVGVFTAADVTPSCYGRSVRDVPVLARDKVRFVGERVAAVVAATRSQAEAAAALVDVDYETLPAALTAAEARCKDAPAVHNEPWRYDGAVATPDDPVNVIYRGTHGSAEDVEAALSEAAYVVDQVYRTPSVHQGYLEPQACIADYRSPQEIKVWLTNKAPFRIRDILASCLGVAPATVELIPMTLGGDFGGKGSPQDAPICVELSRLVGRPVKTVLRYAEDLSSANPRHPAEIRVRIGCGSDGRIVAAAIAATLNAGAYAGFTPNGIGPHGAAEMLSYRVPHFASEIVRVYTNTVPRGNMRAPGGPQATFAIESALDELAGLAGLTPVELRRRNLLTTGERATSGNMWIEHRGIATLDAALDAVRPVELPTGWLYGRGVAVYSRATASKANTSLRLVPIDDGRLRVETPVIETGTGSHTALRRLIGERLGLPEECLDIVGVSTDALPDDAGAGGSRVTATMAAVADATAAAWRNRDSDGPLVVELKADIRPYVGSYTVQIAQVGVDPDTGELRVLELLTAVDVADVVNPMAHQMQINGGATMGFGYACTEDLVESDGQVWAANLGEFKLPSARDVPSYRTVRVPGAIGVGAANVKNIGESTTPAVAAAIANAVFDATGCRVRELPLTAERIYRALREPRCA